MAKTKKIITTSSSEKNKKSPLEPTTGKSKKRAAPAEPSKPVVAEIVDDDSYENHDNESNVETNKVEVIEDPYAADDEFEEPTAERALSIPSEAKTLTTTDPLALYLSEISRYRVLTREEEMELAKKYVETKDPEIAETLVKSNLRFVVKVAAEYSKFGSKMIDLIQEGNVGLMHAVREFNPYKGARLITYAVWWIRGYIQEYLMRQYSLVRIGTTQNQRKLFYQLQKEKDALDSMGIEPNLSLISSRLGIPENEVRDMAMRMSGRDLSLDRPVNDESGASFGEMQSNEDVTDLEEQLGKAQELSLLKNAIEELRPELSERELIILDERILSDAPLTLQEIGEKHGITREAVRQMEVRVMKKIRNKLEEKHS